jgi:hypothetical protein
VELSNILVKTAKGVDEIQTRANRLVQKKRQLLILVDGSASVDDMVARFPGLVDLRQNLQELVEEGYVGFKEPVVPAMPAASTPTIAAAEASSFSEAARTLSRNLFDLIGPTADDFTGKLEGARDRAGFLQATRSSVMMVESFAGKIKAEQFRQRAMAIADRFFKE